MVDRRKPTGLLDALEVSDRITRRDDKDHLPGEEKVGAFYNFGSPSFILTGGNQTGFQVEMTSLYRKCHEGGTESFHIFQIK